MKKLRLSDVFVGIVGVIVVVWILLCTFYVEGTSCTSASGLNNFLLFLTFIVLVVYTNETNRLREEAQKQNIMDIRPVVIPYFQGGAVLAKNKAEGIAINIYLLEWHEEEFKISGSDINPFALAPNDEFHFNKDQLKQYDPSVIKELLPYTPERISELIKTITSHKTAICLVYSDLDDRGYYTVSYAKPGSTAGDNRLEIGKLY